MVEVSLVPLVLVNFFDYRDSLSGLWDVEVGGAFVIRILANDFHLLLFPGCGFFAHFLLLGNDGAFN